MIYCGDALTVLRTLPPESVHCCVTSPPYWGLRDYGVIGQIGLERTPEEYVSRMVKVFSEVRRVLRDDGTLWINIGDSYNNREGQRRHDGERMDVVGWKQSTNGGSCTVGSRHAPNLKPKDLVGIPWMLAFALRADGWYLRSEIIWHKPNPMPESVKDRPTKAHEQIFLLAKSEAYFYDADAISEPSQLREFRRPHGWADEGDHSAADWSIRRAGGKNGAGAKQSAGRRMAENTNAARDSGKPHDSPFGDTRNKRTVWTVTTEPYPEAHFATFPEKLIQPCIMAGCTKGGTVLDPFAGAGTTGLVAKRLHCEFIGIELNQEYVQMAEKRLSQEVLPF